MLHPADRDQQSIFGHAACHAALYIAARAVLDSRWEPAAYRMTTTPHVPTASF